jgi:FKBP-type peptidyl-prolyl cis-trans isomerase
MIFRCLGQQDLGIYPEYNLQQYCQLVAPRPTEGHQTALALQLQQHMQQSSQMKQMPSSQQNQQSNQQSQQQNTQQNTQQMQQNQQMQQMQQMQQQMQSQQNTSGARWSCQELAAAATKNRFVDGFEFQVPEKKILELAQV